MAYPVVVTKPLRIGFVPEHFSAPLRFAVDYYGLQAELVEFPGGTGAMIQALRDRDIDISIGLTEGFIAGLGSKRNPDGTIKREGGYSLVGTYVETPLCWAISTGANREDITSVEGLRGRKMGVSRLGSGSHIMGFVLADEHKWFTGNPTTSPFTAHPLQDFQNLREAVNDRRVDFFMWEHFTSKKFFTSQSPPSTSQSSSTQASNAPSLASSVLNTPSTVAHTTSSFQSHDSARASPGLQPNQQQFSLPSPNMQNSHPSFNTAPADKIRKIGEIYTPWPSWHIVARHPTDGRLPGFFESLNLGIDHFNSNKQESINWIVNNLPYSREDAEAWMNTVRFARKTQGVRPNVVNQTVGVLRKAGVLAEVNDPEEITRMIGEDYAVQEDSSMSY